MSFASPSQDSGSTVCFANREEAGERLAEAVVQAATDFIAQKQPFVVYALPRGGLPIATPIAQRLGCPLDVLVAKKITRPENPELAIGAVTADGHTLWLPQPRSRPQLEQLNEQARHRAQAKAKAQLQELAHSRPQVSLEGAIALIVDDGIATGMTMAVAVEALRSQHPAQIWICVPVAPIDLVPLLKSWADRVFLLATPYPFYSVSRFYQEFAQVDMAEAIACLQLANASPPRQ